MRQTVKQWTGIPTSIDIAPTKTLAKIANHLAKADPSAKGVVHFNDQTDWTHVLSQVEVGQVWGIGRHTAEKLQARGIKTALQLSQADQDWIRRKFNVITLRTVLELGGLSCLPVQTSADPKQGMMVSRCFGRPVTDLTEMREAVAAWGISIPHTNQLSVLLGSRAGTRVVAFHLVERGYLTLTPTDGCACVVEAGEMVICFGGGAHQISHGLKPQILSIERLINGEPNPFRSESHTTNPSVACICGVFLLQNTHLNPLFAGLPPLLHTAVSQAGTFHNLSGVAALMAQELHHSAPGSNYMVERLLALLCAEAVRSYLDRIQPGQIGWLAGLKDPLVSRALVMIHAESGADWSVTRLAQGVAMSPSRFAARFTISLGESPMGYVSQWRMNVASRLLSSTEKTVSEIAADVGYESLAAFNRAFKRHLDLPPAAWRSRSRSG